MTSIGPRAVHLPPIPTASTPNLLTSVAREPRPTDPRDGRWETGIAYQPPRYLGGGSVDPCTSSTKTITDSPATVEWDPYVIWSADQCDTLGDFDEVNSRARAELAAQTSHKIEEILWSNTVAGTDFGASHPNVGLSDASLVERNTVPTQAQINSGSIYTPNAYDAVPPVTGFKNMTEALSDMLGGARGMIHVEKRLLPLLAFYGLAIQNGQRLTTTLGDHVVVPGTGYDGSGPNGEAASENYSWLVGTSMVEVLLSPIEVFGERGQLIDRTNNNVEIRAERLALAHWDRQAHIALSICLEDPAGDCSDAGS